jgi:broad specificity phosphatase PhoE
MGDLILLRHGETEWSRAGKHTGRTDIPLTPRGEAAAASLAPLLAGFEIAAVFTSPAKRAIRTAELALSPLAAAAEVDPDLWEWDYGGYEGMTTPEIQQFHPGWYLWRDGIIPGDPDHPGETVENVGERADRVLDRVRPLLPIGDIVLVAHGHVLRVLTARWLGLEPSGGRLFHLDTGTLSTLSAEHAEPVILSWNVPGASPRLPRRGNPPSRPQWAPR